MVSSEWSFGTWLRIKYLHSIWRRSLWSVERMEWLRLRKNKLEIRLSIGTKPVHAIKCRLVFRMESINTFLYKCLGTCSASSGLFILCILFKLAHLNLVIFKKIHKIFIYYNFYHYLMCWQEYHLEYINNNPLWQKIKTKTRSRWAPVLFF